MEALCYKLINFSKRRAYVLTPNRAVYIIKFFEDIVIFLRFQDCHLFCRPTIAVCKNQVLDLKDFTLLVYTIKNYYNIYFKDFILNLI